MSSPFVLEFVLSYLEFPAELAPLRLVSKRWSEAVLRALNYQLKQWEDEAHSPEELKKNEK